MGDSKGSKIEGSVLFAGLSQRELAIVDGFMHHRLYQAGEIVFDAGEDGQALYVIASGQIDVCLPGRHAAPVAQLAAGDFFGEMGLLDDSPRSAQTRAASACELAVLFRGDFERLMASHARIASLIALQLARQLGLRLRRMLQAEAEK